MYNLSHVIACATHWPRPIIGIRGPNIILYLLVPFIHLKNQNHVLHYLFATRPINTLLNKKNECLNTHSLIKNNLLFFFISELFFIWDKKEILRFLFGELVDLKREKGCQVWKWNTYGYGRGQVVGKQIWWYESNARKL